MNKPNSVDEIIKGLEYENKNFNALITKAKKVEQDYKKYTTTKGPKDTKYELELMKNISALQIDITNYQENPDYSTTMPSEVLDGLDSIFKKYHLSVFLNSEKGISILEEIKKDSAEYDKKNEMNRKISRKSLDKPFDI